MTLTVKQLINELLKKPQDAPVYLATDKEGNSFGEMDEGCIDDKYIEAKCVVLFPASVIDAESLEEEAKDAAKAAPTSEAKKFLPGSTVSSR